MKTDYGIKRMVQSAFVKNSGWIMAEQVYRLVLSFFISVMTARFLGPANQGVVTYAAAYVSAFHPIASLCLEHITIREMVSKPAQMGTILGTGVLMRLIASVFSMVTIIIIVSVLNHGEMLYIQVAFLTSLWLVFNAFTLADSWLQVQLRSKYTTIIKSIGYTCMSLYKVYLLATKKSVLWFAFSSSLDMLVIAGLYCWFYFISEKQMVSFSSACMKRLLKQSCPFIVANLVAVVYGQLDRVLVQQYHGDIALGVYGIGANLSYLWQFVPAAVLTSARPLILREKENNQQQYLKRLKQLYGFIWWLSILAGVGFTLFGDWIVLLLYKQAYQESAAVLKTVIWSQGFSLLAGVRTVWLLAENKNKYLIHCQTLSAFFSVGVNYLLIPRYGIIGAAFATLINQFFVAMLSTLPFKPVRESTKLMLDGILMKWK